LDAKTPKLDAAITKYSRTFPVMDKLIVQLGKTGDVLSILPVAHMATRFGKRLGIMTCAEYAPLLDGCSYVDKVVFDGKPWEIERAVEQAKKLCPAVHVTQVNGPADVVKKFSYEPASQEHSVTDSFDRESWNLLKLLNEWGKEPLVFDQRDPAEESMHLPARHPGKKKKVILIAPDSVSSPFPYRDLLLTLVRLKYGKEYNVINLSDIRSRRFYNLLGLYEIAHCLITVDTAHLHLARAVPSLPVMALVQDTPSYWHGTAWRPSHHFHCRYGDFPKRALEMFTAIDEIGHTSGFLRHCYPGEIRPSSHLLESKAIQPGSVGRDSALVLNDNEHFPMLRDALTMHLSDVSGNYWLCLTRKENKSNLDGYLDGLADWDLGLSPTGVAYYAYRLHKGQFVPAADLFCAPAEFWRTKILPELPDLVMSQDAWWSRVLVELFKAHGAREIEPVIYDV
jgi:hypothetical protein